MFGNPSHGRVTILRLHSYRHLSLNRLFEDAGMLCALGLQVRLLAILKLQFWLIPLGPFWVPKVHAGERASWCWDSNPKSNRASCFEFSRTHSPANRYSSFSGPHNPSTMTLITAIISYGHDHYTPALPFPCSKPSDFYWLVGGLVVNPTTTTTTES
jgi:hypothetical protein